jgi:hypothetical protein
MLDSNSFEDGQIRNGQPVTLILVAGLGGRGAEAKPWANGQFFKLYFIHATSPVNHSARYFCHPG